MLTPIEINEGGLVAKGFIAGYGSVVSPAEYRGVSIRVRGVAIGEPTFLGAEFLLTGAHKAALSQISGEINVLRGLDAVDSLNPGRESFYEESTDFQILKRAFRGDGERVSGFLGKTIDAVLRRSQARSALQNVLGRAAYIRRAIDDVSAGVTHLISSGDKPAAAIRQMLKSKKSHVNGLGSTKPAPFGVPTKIGSFRSNRPSDYPNPFESTTSLAKSLSTLLALSGTTTSFCLNDGSMSSTCKDTHHTKSLRSISRTTAFWSTGASGKIPDG